MSEVRSAAALGGRTDANVLIVGATGTGKELVARAIHRGQRFSRGPFVPHNCAATPADLFESTFFGHRRGAFTGADRDHVGLLVQADGGILFLDELEALPPAHQAKLLRVLDDGEVRPVGAAETCRVAVRFLAALNRDPAQLIAAGALRDDLYYRLRGIEIRLPPLRERAQDIPLLAGHFLGAGRAVSPPGSSVAPEGPGGEASAGEPLTPDALALLQSYAWPGNVRELKNVLLGARAVAREAPIAPRHLPDFLRPARVRDVPAAAPPPAATLHDLEIRAIRDALAAHGGNVSRAARALGIDRSTLRRKLAGEIARAGP